jgi:hypothetical protein
MSEFSFLFYPGDYLRDTFMLSPEAQQSYDHLMCGHMKNICFTYEQLKPYIKNLSPDQSAELFAVLTKGDDGYFIEWIRQSIEKRKAFCESRKKNRLKKDDNEKNISNTYVKHMLPHMEIEKEIEIEYKDKGGAGEKGNILTWIKSDAKSLLKFTDPLRADQADDLVDRFGAAKVIEVLTAMDNRKDLSRKNVSVYKTCISWINYSNQKNKQNAKPNSQSKYSNLRNLAKDIITGSKSE